MRVLVLGGCGFIGSHVVDELLAAGHSVRILSRSPDPFRPPLPGVDYRLADFGDPPSVAEALEGMNTVFHLISTTVPSTSNLDPVWDIQTNLINTVRLLQLMIQKGIPRIVYLSSGGTIYGKPQQLPIPEDHPTSPICSYGIVKLAVERYLNMYHELHGLECTVLRPSNPYGERQGHFGVQGAVGTFLGRAKQHEEIEIWGDGSVVRDYIHVRDLARLCVQALEQGGSSVYNAGYGAGHSLKQILEAIEAAVGRPLKVNYKPGRGFDVKEIVLDISCARQQFDWKPEIDLTTGIAQTWEWLSKQP